MSDGPHIRMLPDGRRLHLNHGPIDLIVEAMGDADQVARAYDQAKRRFIGMLDELVAELGRLRAPVARPRWYPTGPVAQRMAAAAWPHRANFVTPMAAVAGAVADEILASLTVGRTLDRAYVNDGGDIAFHLSPGEQLTVGLVGDYHLPAIDATCALGFHSAIRGIASSGWKGRSFSLGIADSVTVLASNAAAADVAATLIANAVNVEDPAIERAPASSLDPDSDLAERLVTVAVGDLKPGAVTAALDAGREVAAVLERAGLICAAVLVLRQHYRVAGEVPAGLIAATAA
jgi:ApbE superfamily uncharacterized protein (UPF0280 family)